VVNIGSVSASLITPFAGAYCASKAAVHALTQAMQMELAPFNIRVLLAITGAINTGFANRARQEAEQTLTATSWWAPYRAGVLKRARASQNRPTPVEHYAKALVSAIQTPGLTQVRLGSGSLLLPLLSLLPQRLLQWILRRHFLQ
jgi:short-subunit dehydrogenase